MRTSLYAFASDLADAGAASVLDDVQAAGVDGVTLAAAYHAARDLFPHARGRRVRFLRGGDAAFVPDPALWGDAQLVPHAAQGDVLGDLVRDAGARGMHVDGWTVFLHVDRELDLPDGLAEETAFGDPLPTQLCPANPEVRRYAVTLAREVARRGVRAVVAESLHHHGLQHGYHHERAFVALPPSAWFLFGICFCRFCRAAAPDGDAVRDAAAAALDEALAADDPGRDELPLDRAVAAALLDGALGRYLAARESTVTSLVAEVAEACRQEGSELVFLDSSGAALGYATGRPQGPPAPETAWSFGVDLPAVARAASAVGAIAYAADPDRVATDLDAYAAAAGPAALEVVMRPTRPDCEDAANLRAKLDACRARDVRTAGLYHYGLVSRRALARVGEALRPE